MSHGFKLRYDQMRENNPSDNPVQTESTETYQTAGHTRNVCFNWPDGRRLFLNYAYLLSCDFKPDMDRNRIRLTFSSHVVLLEGFKLESLFLALLDHLPRFISALDERYLANAKEDVIVTAIQVEGGKD